MWPPADSTSRVSLVEKCNGWIRTCEAHRTMPDKWPAFNKYPYFIYCFPFSCLLPLPVSLKYVLLSSLNSMLFLLLYSVHLVTLKEAKKEKKINCKNIKREPSQAQIVPLSKWEKSISKWMKSRDSVPSLMSRVRARLQPPPSLPRSLPQPGTFAQWTTTRLNMVALILHSQPSQEYFFPFLRTLSVLCKH